MQCYKCSKPMSQEDNFMIPIDPIGPGRRWACSDCATPEQVNDVPEDVKDICDVVNPGCFGRDTNV